MISSLRCLPFFHRISTAAMALVFSVFASHSAHALAFRVTDNVQQQRFASGFPNDAVVNLDPSFLLAGFDLSGIGWNEGNTGQGITLVSPQYFVGANHYGVGGGSSVSFLSTGGVKRTYSVDSIFNVRNGGDKDTDLYVGRLSAPIAAADGVNFLRVSSQTEAQQTGDLAYLYGSLGSVGTSLVAGFGDFTERNPPINSTRGIFLDDINSSVGVNNAHVSGGDSSSPTFLIEDGNLALIGVHSALNGVSGGFRSVDTSVLAYSSQVNTILAADGYSLTAVPEPKTTALLIMALVTFVLVRRRLAFSGERTGV